MYRLYVNDADFSVTPEGVCFLRNIGWHPETNAFVAASDDWILWQRGMIKKKPRLFRKRVWACLFLSLFFLVGLLRAWVAQ